MPHHAFSGRTGACSRVRYRPTKYKTRNCSFATFIACCAFIMSLSVAEINKIYKKKTANRVDLLKRHIQ